MSKTAELTTAKSRDLLTGSEGAFTASALAQTLLFRTAGVLPTLTKQWWDEDCPRSLQSPVSDFVERCVAPETLRSELNRIGRADLGELSVSGSLISREVTATYEQDECQLSVVIAVPANFPLRNVKVDGRKTLGVPETRWKRWALQIRVILNNEDGNLLDALQLWKDNVDKEFEGLEPVPPCAIRCCPSKGTSSPRSSARRASTGSTRAACTSGSARAERASAWCGSSPGVGRG